MSNNNKVFSFMGDLIEGFGCFGVVIIIVLAYLFIVYVLLPGIAIAIVLSLVVLALGALWGLLCSLKNFIVAMKHNITFKGEGAK